MDVVELVPRVRRAIEGVGATSGLTEGEVAAVVADAAAEIIFYTNGYWGYALVVTERDNTTNAPTEWAIEPDLSESEQTVIAVQAALDFFFHAFREQKASETITRDGASWSWSVSANLLTSQFELLIRERDRALELIGQQHPVTARFASFLEVRDAATARVLEPYLHGQGGEFQLHGGGGGELVY